MGAGPPTALITGGNQGIGYATARLLLLDGYRVVLACRNAARAEAACAALSPLGRISPVSVDLADLRDVARCAEEIRRQHAHVDALILNAGVFLTPPMTTVDGIESQFGINHLGHFALFEHLQPILHQARVVSVSSSAHRYGRIDFDRLEHTSGYQPWRAYAQSKLANLLFIRALNRLHGGRFLGVACHPGYCATNLQHHLGLAAIGNRILAQSSEAGARIVFAAATDPHAKANDYFVPHGLLGLRGAPERGRMHQRARDEDLALRLWETCQQLIKTRGGAMNDMSTKHHD